jgi:uncharacterized membrane protein
VSSSSQRPVGKRSTAAVFYTLALGSGVMRTISVGFDIVAINTVLSDAIIYGFISQWTSYMVSVALVLFLSIRVRKDKRALFAGVATYSYYAIAGSTDASAVLPYGQLVIIYLLIGDLVAEKDTPTIIEVQCILSILIGVLLVGTEPGGFNIATLLIVLVPMNMASALNTYYQRKTKRFEIQRGLRVDSLNMRIWTLLVLNTVMSLLMLPTFTPESWGIMGEMFNPLFWYMVGSSVATFMSLVMYVRALGKGSMSVVNSLSAISVVLGIPMTLFGNLLVPGAFGVITTDMFLWTIRIFGVILVLVAIAALQGTEVRSLVIISVRPLTGDILPALFNIRGVERVAGLAGPHDYLLSIRSRSLGKTRTNILKKIQEIPEVKEIETLVVLRDYK